MGNNIQTVLTEKEAILKGYLSPLFWLKPLKIGMSEWTGSLKFLLIQDDKYHFYEPIHEGHQVLLLLFLLFYPTTI